MAFYNELVHEDLEVCAGIVASTHSKRITCT